MNHSNNNSDYRERKDDSTVEQRSRRPLVLFVAAGVLLLSALILLFVTSPSPTILSVRVVDADTGDPVPGASVRIGGRTGESLPPVTTNQNGMALFKDVPADSAYLIRIQRTDYELTFEPGVIVTAGKKTEVEIPISPGGGGRLYVGMEGGRVAEVDTASMLVVRALYLSEVMLAATRHIRVHPSEDMLYAVAGTEGVILDTQSGTSLKSFELEGIVESLSTDGTLIHIVSDEGQAVQSSNAEGSNVFVAEHGRPGRLLTLDAHSGELLDSTEAYGPLWSLLLIWKPGGDRLFVVDPSSWSLWLLDADPASVLQHTLTGAYPKEGFSSADGHYRYTWSADSFENLKATYQHNLSPVFTNQLSFVSTSAFSLSPIESELYVLDAQLGTFSILDPTGEIPPTLIAVGKRPVALVVSPDGQWAYVANRESRTISVIYLPSLRVVQTIPLEGVPLSLAIR